MKPFTEQEDDIIRRAVADAMAEGKTHTWRKKAMELLPGRRPDIISYRKARLYKEKESPRVTPTWRIELEDGTRIVTMARYVTDAMAVLHPNLARRVIRVNRQ